VEGRTSGGLPPSCGKKNEAQVQAAHYPNEIKPSGRVLFLQLFAFLLEISFYSSFSRLQSKAIRLAFNHVEMEAT